MRTPATIAELLADPVLAEARLLAGVEGADRDVVDVRWSSGDLGGCAEALVVCNAAHATPPYRLDALLRRAHEVGSAGLLVVGAGGDHLLLSSTRLADRLCLPLLWMEHHDPTTLAIELTLVMRAPAERRARIVEQLLRRLANRRTGQELLAATEATLDATVSLVSPDGSPLLGQSVDLTDTGVPTEPVPTRRGPTVLHPVLSPAVDHIAAWLVCRCEQASRQRLDVLALGLAVTEPFIRSWLAVQRVRAGQSAAYQSRLLSEILDSRDAVSRTAAEGAVSLGWRLQGWHVGIYLRPDTQDGPSDIDHLTGHTARSGITVAAALSHWDGYVLWQTTETEPTAQEARQLLTAVRQLVAEMPEEWRIVAGIGRARHGPHGLADTLYEARDAANLASSHEFRPAVEHSDELGVARLLSTWQRSEITRNFADSVLAPLQQRQNAPLLATLRVYLESGASVVVAAQTLGVHRNTVASRIQHTQEILGVDLADANLRLALQIACRALQG